jgi:hypothetical protein
MTEIWFLVAWSGLQWIGPLTERDCRAAAGAAAQSGVTCRAASALTTCEVPHVPGSVMTCPVFDFPEVTIKPDK